MENYILLHQILDLVLSRIVGRNCALNSRFPVQIPWTQTWATRHALETLEGTHNTKSPVKGLFLAFFNIYTCLESACLTNWDDHKHYSVTTLKDFVTHIAMSILFWRLGVGYAVYSYCISYIPIHATCSVNPPYFILSLSNIYRVKKFCQSVGRYFGLICCCSIGLLWLPCRFPSNRRTLQQSLLHFLVPWTPLRVWWNLRTPTQKNVLSINNNTFFEKKFLHIT